MKVHKKFTLLELLVVVAIIGILISILLPAMGNARLKGQQAVCMSNLKQQTTALFMWQNTLLYRWQRLFWQLLDAPLN
jgi:prepilin-type N-terminal cleavage/methylation domain-containing protein